MTNRVEADGPDAGRPPGCPAGEEDGINLLKAFERSGRENWQPDAAGGYTDQDGFHRDRYGDRERVGPAGADAARPGPEVERGGRQC